MNLDYSSIPGKHTPENILPVRMVLLMKYNLTTCCAQKRKDERLLPAKIRYQSPRVQTVVAESERTNTPLLIFSGEFGILDADEPIPWYDKALTEEDIEAMVSRVISQMQERPVTEVTLFARPKDTPGWMPYYAVIEQACEGLGIPITIEILDLE